DNFLSMLLAAIAVSVDCFSVAVALGFIRRRMKHIVSVSFILGFFHTAFPLIGLLFGVYMFPFIHHLAAFLNSFFFFTLGFFTLFSRFEKSKQMIFTRVRLLVICMLVSVDSFPIGITFGITDANNVWMVGIFGITATILSFFGLYFARHLRGRIGVFGELVSASLFIYLGWKY